MVSLRGASLRYGETHAVDNVSLDIPANRMVGLTGPDGVGRSSLLALSAGVRKIQNSKIRVLDGDMCDRRHRRVVCPCIVYMLQGLGKNLYPTPSVFESVDLFGRLFGHDKTERERRIADPPQSTGLVPFAKRPAGKLSGGMEQKLGPRCALVHDPDLLILDEPITGVDPLSRNQFWELTGRIRAGREGMSVLVVTVYTEEAERFNWLVAMDDGKVLATDTLQELCEHTGMQSLELAFITLLSGSKCAGHHRLVIPPRPQSEGAPWIAIEAEGLTCRFGDFVVVDHVSFRIEREEIFGFLGSNDCGKSITMKMPTGLLPASEGTCASFDQAVGASDMVARRRVGYIFQAFSLYVELNARQDLVLHVRLFHLPVDGTLARVGEMPRCFDLEKVVDELPDDPPLGIRQRLLLAVAVIHKPKILILDEPISGVDPVTRDGFRELMVELLRRDGMTIFISTHLANEVQRHDRISLTHADKVLASDTPDELVRQRSLPTLEATFTMYPEEAAGAAVPAQPAEASAVAEQPGDGQGRQA